MDSMVETQACSLFSAPDFHISSFLEDFQDKNSHLFPSTDLSFDQTETDNSLQCGSKRKRDCLYESFSEWDEELLSADSLEQPTLDVLSSGNIANTTETIEQEINSHIDKKQKLGILDEELQIFEADACSSSPPFHAIEFDLESIPIQPNPNEITNLTPTKPEQDFHGGTVPRGVNALHVISQLDDSVRSSISQSLLRIADKFESGKIPVSSKQCGSIEEQISNAQDYLTMQMLLQIPIPSAHAPLIKSDQFYSVSSGAIPFIMNGSFAVTDPSIPKYIDENDFSAYKQSLAAKAFYSKNVIYPAQPKFLPGQGFGPTTLIPTQNVYTHPNLHATTL